MSQNSFGREYQIPSGPHNSASNNPHQGDEFDIAFQQTTQIEVKSSDEFDIHPLTMTLRTIHGFIDQARNQKIENYSTIRGTDNGGMMRGIASALFVRGVAGSIRPRVTENTITKRELIERESVEGGYIFGFNDGKTKKFFCDENGEYFYCEESESKEGNSQYSIYHYIPYDRVVLAIKEVPGQKMRHEHIDADSEEAKNLTRAVELYYERVMQNIYPESNIVNLDEYRKNDNSDSGKTAA